MVQRIGGKARERRIFLSRASPIHHGRWSEGIHLVYMRGCEFLEAREQGLLARETISRAEGFQQLFECLVDDFGFLIQDLDVVDRERT